MLKRFDTILLDMNNTFMFDHDRFGDDQNYGAFFKKIGGALSEREASAIIREVFEYLQCRYPVIEFQECFPSVESALATLLPEGSVSKDDCKRLIATFAHHERGTVPPAYREALHKLAAKFKIGLVADIWAPKDFWLDELRRTDVYDIFRATSFSSDTGIVKPSPKPFLQVLQKMEAAPESTVIIGDSVRRDLGGALAAGLPCVLVGGKKDSAALGCTDSLLDLL